MASYAPPRAISSDSIGLNSTVEMQSPEKKSLEVIFASPFQPLG